MMGFDRAALDRHITGNYGEDQFRRPMARTATRCGAKVKDRKCKHTAVDIGLDGHTPLCRRHLRADAVASETPR